MVRESPAESQAFCVVSCIFSAPQAASCVVSVHPPASFLAPSPHKPLRTAPSASAVAPHLQVTASTHDAKTPTGSRETTACWMRSQVSERAVSRLVYRAPARNLYRDGTAGKLPL